MLPSEMPHYIDGIEIGKQNLKVIVGTTSKLTMFTNVYESEV